MPVFDADKVYVYASRPGNGGQRSPLTALQRRPPDGHERQQHHHDKQPACARLVLRDVALSSMRRWSVGHGRKSDG